MNVARTVFFILIAASLLSAQSNPSGSSTQNAGSNSASTSARNVGNDRYVLPAGTEIEIRINEALSSESSQQGERFTGEVSSDVNDSSSGRVLIPRGAQVEGRVLSATPSGRLSNSGELQLSINTIRNGSSVTNITVQPFIDKGESHTKSNTTKIGGGAAIGAIIGAIAGGGKGAAIGAGVGGAAGAGAAAAGGKRPAEVKPEAVLKFVTATDTTVMASTAQTSPAQTSRTSTYPDSSSSSNFPAPSSSETTSPGTSSSDAPPVLQKRPGSSASDTTAGSSTIGTPRSTSSTTNTQSNYPSTTSPTSSTQSTYPSTTSATTIPTQVDSRAFSARDRRVINSCIRDHASSLPDVALRKIGVARSYQKGDTIGADVQRQVRALPLQCDRELPQLSNDLERVIYGGQVMLIDTASRVLDIFDLTQ